VIIRDAEEKDFQIITRMNTSVVDRTSPMDEARVRELDQLAHYHRVVEIGDQVAGFLLAMADSAPYENLNFDWFSERYDQFIYIDRIVIDEVFTGQKLGTYLYRDLFETAKAEGFARVLCEYNLLPANLPSREFHRRLGFTEVGRRTEAGGQEGQKVISMQKKELG